MNSRPYKRLILASESPRRKELLFSLGLSFDIKVSGINESRKPHESPPSTAERLAVMKAQAVAANEESGVVLAADTVIDLSGVFLGKPENENDAFRILSEISGHTHDVITGVAAIDSESGKVLSSVVITKVTMTAFGPAETEEYIKSGEPTDKAGAYAIQGIGNRLVESISGCYNNVVGFPLCEVIVLLRRLGLSLEKTDYCFSPDGSICPRIVSG